MSNLIDHLSDDFEFLIVTRDRDLGDEHPYSSVKSGEWIKEGGSSIFYCPQSDVSFFYLQNLIKKTPHDLLYLNSFFDPFFTIRVLLLRFFSRGARVPAILAPRGEFSEGALRLKSNKKRIYIRVSRLFHLYAGITFQASSEFERDDIVNALRVSANSVKIAVDLPAHSFNSDAKAFAREDNTSSNGLRLVFVSRISPMKNLDYALRVLKSVREFVQFDIYGPKEDHAYWMECSDLISTLPANIATRYCGAVPSSDVRMVFSQYDIFLFPTRGENYGHVIAEAVSVGTPVLISNQTPWKGLESHGLGWDLPLDRPESFSEVIDQFAKIPFGIREEKRKSVRRNALIRLLNSNDVSENKRLFNLQLAGCPD